MSEQKHDELSATGSHRAWNGEAARPVARPAAGGDPQRNWLDRAHMTLPARPPANPRHAAITRSLNSWSNYKSWSDKVRSNWDKDKSGK